MLVCGRKRQSVEKEIKVKILTVSDGVAHGVRENKSSEALVERVSNEGWTIEHTSVTPDGEDEVAKTLVAVSYTHLTLPTIYSV